MEQIIKATTMDRPRYYDKNSMEKADQEVQEISNDCSH